uniref:Uncharacterized protein MANES_05G070100 n=1 Tax=Rhizophora mucronata TaxID=61149 RepID=A0A2P2MGI8_RHIMU
MHRAAWCCCHRSGEGSMSVQLFNLAPDLTVSRLCLGTMTFGEQNSLAQSFRLLDHAFHAGINFFDSAEMYPVPQRAETQGRSEEYFGRWVRERKVPRDRVVLATKVCQMDRRCGLSCFNLFHSPLCMPFPYLLV